MTSRSTEHSESVNAKGTSVVTSIDNNLDDEPYNGQDSDGDSEVLHCLLDHHEEPDCLVIGGLQVFPVVGLRCKKGKVKIVRPPRNKDDNMKDEDDLDKRAMETMAKKKNSGKKGKKGKRASNK